MKTLGIDIGTTSISGVIREVGSGEQITSRTIPNDAFIAGSSWKHEQDAERIYEKCSQLSEELFAEHPDIAAIGFTGQMHGMLYLNQDGYAVSSLITWEDERGNLVYRDGLTYAEYLSQLTGYSMSTGYGLTTHFYHLMNDEVPKDAVKIVTIMDYVSMRFCGNTVPVTHCSNAASFGLFRTDERCFDLEMVRKAGIDPGILPDVLRDERSIGKTERGIPVMVAIGDNQAGVYALIESDDDVLVNIGTSSQISSISQDAQVKAGLECRPFVSGKYISLYAGLCGGVSFSILNDFFCQVCEEFSSGVTKNDMFDRMMSSAEAEYQNSEPLNVSTLFRGTREQPGLRGSISNIGIHNLTPGAVTLAFYRGACQELLNAYDRMDIDPQKGELLLSGNAFRNNQLLRKVCGDLFGRKPVCVEQKEEAAVGAAKLAANLC